MGKDPFSFVSRLKSIKKTKRKPHAINRMNVVCQTVCIVSLVAITIMCYLIYFHKYEYLDAEYPSVNVVHIQEGTDHVYPTATICFGNPFIATESLLRRYNLTMTPNMFLSIYPKFLSGSYWDKIEEKFGNTTLNVFKAINYDDVTILLL